MAVSHQGSPALPEGKALPSRKGRASAAAATDAPTKPVQVQVLDPSPAAKTEPAAEEQAKSTDDTNTAPRRNSGRTRKIPSRLLSPSPPPSRPSTYYNPSKGARAVSVTSKTGSTPTTAAAERPPAGPVNAKAAGRKSMPASSSNEDMGVAMPLGPGKRKRRPSSMSGLPTAITSPADGAASSSTSPTKPAASAGVKAKARKSNSPGPREGEASASASSSKPRKSAGSVRRQPSLQTLTEATASGEYDSDGHGEEEHDDEEDEIGLLGPVSAKKRKGSASHGSNPLLSQVFEPPPLLGRTGTALTGLGESPRQLVVPTPLKASRSRASLEVPARGRGLHGSDPASHFGRYSTARFLLQASQASAAGEESEADDEDDFHKAMLDGGDFDTLDDDEPLGGRAWGSKGACSSDAESTPATTPRSPQSNCDARDRRLGHETPNSHLRDSTDSLKVKTETEPAEPTATASPKGKERARDGAVATVSFNDKATVFAHALPATSRKPGTSAGSLTLSLPYDEEAAHTIRAAPKPSETETAETANVGIGLTVPVVDGAAPGTDNALLSPGQALLGLHGVSKLATGTSSPFGLASVGGPSSPAPLQLGASMWSQDSSDGRDAQSSSQATVSAPPSSSRLAALVAEAAISKASDASVKAGQAAVAVTAGKRQGVKRELDDDDDDEWLAGSSGSISPHSSLSARMEEREEEDLYHLAGAPEAMCLSELDRAWDTSERVEAYKASCVAAAVSESQRRGGQGQEDVKMADAEVQPMLDKAQDERAVAEDTSAVADDEETKEDANLRQGTVKATPPSRRSSRGVPASRRNSTQRSAKSVTSMMSSRRSSSPAEPSGPVALRSGKRGSHGLEDGGSASAKRTTRSGSAAAKEVDTSPSIRRSRRFAS